MFPQRTIRTRCVEVEDARQPWNVEVFVVQGRASINHLVIRTFYQILIKLYPELLIRVMGANVMSFFDGLNLVCI